MGSTGDPSGGSSLAPCGPMAPPRNRKAGRKGVPAMREDIWGSLPELYHKQYRSLFRLALLLTGDPDAAEAVVVDCFAAWCRPRKRPQAEDDALPYLRRQLVARSRRARHHHLWDGSRRPRREGTGPPGCTRTPHQAPRPETSAVTSALRKLPTGQREAIVLTLYLDLNAEQAAAAMRVSPATLRRHLAKATSALRAALPANPQVPPVPPPTASAISQPSPCGTPPDQFARWRTLLRRDLRQAGPVETRPVTQPCHLQRPSADSPVREDEFGAASRVGLLARRPLLRHG